MRLLVVCLFLTTLCSGGTIYQITDLGAAGGSLAYRVSNSGFVVGTGFDPSSVSRGFLHDGAGLSFLPGGSESGASAVNNSGLVAGTTHAGGVSRATVWSGGAAYELGSLGGANSYATAVNNAGEVVGGATDAYGRGVAFVYRDGVMEEVGAGGKWSAAYAINDSGAIAGHRMNSHGLFEAFVRQPDGSVSVIPTGGWSSYAFDLNAFGIVIGQVLTQAGYFRAFLYDGGLVFDLGTLGGSASFAYGINGGGAAVGYSWLPGDETWHAVLYEGGLVLDLNSMIAPGSGWELLEAYGINDDGQIVGAGSYQGQTRAYRLDPMLAPEAIMMVENPEPATWALIALPLLIIVYRSRKSIVN
ncbi:MAG: hypothetical protein ACRD44_13690 [Bryobacteraceae bacterium]